MSADSRDPFALLRSFVEDSPAETLSLWLLLAGVVILAFCCAVTP